MKVCKDCEKNDAGICDQLGVPVAEDDECVLRDQTAKADYGKPRLSLVPMQIIFDIAVVREWAIAHKYPQKDNWKTVEVDRYREALFRHVLRYINDPHGADEETRLPHLWHVSTNCAFLSELEKEHWRII